MGELEAITRHPDPVSAPPSEPGEGKRYRLQASKGGSKRSSSSVQDAAGQSSVQLTDSNFRHARGPWRRVNGKSTGELLLASVPLDRNLNAEQRKNISTVYRLP